MTLDVSTPGIDLARTFVVRGGLQDLLFCWASRIPGAFADVANRFPVIDSPERLVVRQHQVEGEQIDRLMSFLEQRVSNEKRDSADSPSRSCVVLAGNHPRNKRILNALQTLFATERSTCLTTLGESEFESFGPEPNSIVVLSPSAVFWTNWSNERRPPWILECSINSRWCAIDFVVFVENRFMIPYTHFMFHNDNSLFPNMRSLVLLL